MNNEKKKIEGCFTKSFVFKEESLEDLLIEGIEKNKIEKKKIGKDKILNKSHQIVFVEEKYQFFLNNKFNNTENVKVEKKDSQFVFKSFIPFDFNEKKKIKKQKKIKKKNVKTNCNISGDKKVFCFNYKKNNKICEKNLKI
jgi:hypothetical protein